MSLKIKGKITAVLDIENGTSKAGKEWTRGGFVIDTYDQYNPLLCFGLFGDTKIALITPFSVGQEIEVDFNASSREHNGKYYTQCDAWKITATGEMPHAAAASEDDIVDPPF